MGQGHILWARGIFYGLGAYSLGLGHILWAIIRASHILLHQSSGTVLKSRWTSWGPRP